ncbi:phage tail protein, partial [Streptomyces hydrogenans]
MPLPDLDSSVGHSFGLEFDSVIIRQITEVSGLKMEQDVIELKQNTADGKYAIKKLPGRPKAGEVTVSRGLTEDNSFERWIKESRFGRMGEARRNGAIIVY